MAPVRTPRRQPQRVAKSAGLDKARKRDRELEKQLDALEKDQNEYAAELYSQSVREPLSSLPTGMSSDDPSATYMAVVLRSPGTTLDPASPVPSICTRYLRPHKQCLPAIAKSDLSDSKHMETYLQLRQAGIETNTRQQQLDVLFPILARVFEKDLPSVSYMDPQLACISIADVYLRYRLGYQAFRGKNAPCPSWSQLETAQESYVCSGLKVVNKITHRLFVGAPSKDN